jgi:hypothetical protein
MIEAPISHFEYTLPLEKEISLTDEDLFKIAEKYQDIFKNGFEWNCLSRVLIETYDFLLQHKSLPREDLKQKILIVFNHFLDITEIPYFPNEYVDPVFKRLMPSFLDLIDHVASGVVTTIPSVESPTPTAATLSEFTQKLKETFSDGFQLHDIPVCIKASVDFMGSFPFLKKEEKHKCVVKIIDSLIDSSHLGSPEFIVHPIIKHIVHPFIDDIFNRLYAL